MKTLYIFLLWFINFSTLFGQWTISQLPIRPFEQIKYTGTYPKWHNTFYLEDHVTDTTDGYGTPFYADQITDFEYDDNTIVTHEGIYQAYNYKPFWNGSTFTGSYIEKLDINTGALVWRKFFGKPQGKAEFVREMKINQNNQLVLINQQSINDDQNFLNAKDLILSIRVLDIKTGQELSYTSADSTTGLRIPFSVFSSVSELFCEDDCKKIRYTTLHFPPDNIYAKTYTSKAIDTNTSQNDIEYDTLYSAKDYIPFEIKQLNDESLFVTVLDTANRKFDFKIMNSDFTPVSQYSSDVFPKSLSKIYLWAFDKPTRSLLFSNRLPFNPPIQFYPTYEFYKIDGQGKVSDVYVMPDKYQLGNYAPLTWKHSDTIYMINSQTNYSNTSRVYNTLDILKCVPGDTCRIVKRYLSTDSLRNISSFGIHEIDDDEIYMRFYEGSVYYDSLVGGFQYDEFARAMSGMRINVKELINGTSSLNDFQLIGDVTCYPNPSRDLVYVQLPILTSGQYKIYDMSGKEITKNSFNNQKELAINISQLAQGRYEMSISTDNQKLYRSRFVKL